jgi:predicted homoserine dehydrogenase-like protein
MKMDGIGGEACFGQVDTVAGAEGLMPIGISEHATLRRAIKRDEPIALDDVEIDEEAQIVKCRAEQDRLIHDLEAPA